jgi:cytoskeleton protein RodZ
VENSVIDDGAENPEFRFQTVGEQLKTARETMGLSLSEIAQRTRVPMRHLEAIELSQYGALPGSTYSVGFAKAYARAVDMDAVKVASDLRIELAQGGFESASVSTPSYQPADSARVPPRRLAWLAAAFAVLLLVGYFAWRSYALGPETAPGDVPEEQATIAAETPKAAADDIVDPKGQVVLAATDTVWVRIYDADKKRLFEKEMQAGEKFEVPADANNPMINTGRPQAITVTVGGKTVPALGAADIAISDIGVSGAVLLAREAPATPAVSANSERPQTNAVQ